MTTLRWDRWCPRGLTPPGGKRLREEGARTQTSTSPVFWVRKTSLRGWCPSLLKIRLRILKRLSSRPQSTGAQVNCNFIIDSWQHYSNITVFTLYSNTDCFVYFIFTTCTSCFHIPLTSTHGNNQCSTRRIKSNLHAHIHLHTCTALYANKLYSNFRI